MYNRYQPSQKQPQNQYVGLYPDPVCPRNGLIMAELLGYQVSDGQNHLTEPAYQNRLTEPAYQNHPTEPAYRNHLTEPAYQNRLTEPAYQNRLTEPAYRNHLTESAYWNHLTEPAYWNHLTEPAYQNHPTEPAYRNHLTEPAYQNHFGEAACNYHLTERAYQNHPPGPADQNPTRDPSYQHHHPAQMRFSQDVAEPPPAAPPPPPDSTPTKRKRGRPAKRSQTEQRAEGRQRAEEEEEEKEEKEKEKEASKKAKRVLKRFDGMPVEEVMARTLPDVIAPNLDILIIGINPGLLSAYKGHHYPSPGNHFWKCLFLSGFTEKQLNYSHDQSLPEIYGIGFTNMVERTTPGSKDLSNKEIREGGRQLLVKLQKYRPLIAAFNGKGIYEIFCKETFGVKAKSLEFGLQPYTIPDTQTVCYLMPSSSPRCAQFPRAQDKVHFYIKLKELRDQIKGVASGSEVQETRYSFDLQLAKEDARRTVIKEEQDDPEYESCSGQQRPDASSREEQGAASAGERRCGQSSTTEEE